MEGVRCIKCGSHRVTIVRILGFTDKGGVQRAIVTFRCVDCGASFSRIMRVVVGESSRQ